MRERRELYNDVLIYNLAINGWIHWNGRELRYNDVPHRSAYCSTAIFLLYFGTDYLCVLNEDIGRNLKCEGNEIEHHECFAQVSSFQVRQLAQP